MSLCVFGAGDTPAPTSWVVVPEAPAGAAGQDAENFRFVFPVYRDFAVVESVMKFSCLYQTGTFPCGPGTPWFCLLV